MLSKRRNKTAATKFFARAMEVNGLPRKIVIDKSGANTAGITAINLMLARFGCPIPIEMVRIKYLNIEPEAPPVRAHRRGVEQITAVARSGSDQCAGSSHSHRLRQPCRGWRSPT